MKDISMAFLFAAIIQFGGFFGTLVVSLIKEDSTIFISNFGTYGCILVICFLFMGKLEIIEEKLDEINRG